MSRKIAKEKSDGGELDDFPSPLWTVDRLLEDVHLPAGRWLEPTAGAGNIIRAVDRGPFSMPNVNWTAVEIQERYAGDLETLGADVITGNFLDTGVLSELKALRKRREGAWAPRWAFDLAIGNPPYSLAEEIVSACRQLAPIVAMLLRLNYVASAKRAEAHRVDMPEYIWGLPDRPAFRGAGGDSCEYGWFIWTQVKTPEARLRMLKTTPLEIRRPGTKRGKKSGEGPPVFVIDGVPHEAWGEPSRVIERAIKESDVLYYDGRPLPPELNWIAP